MCRDNTKHHQNLEMELPFKLSSNPALLMTHSVMQHVFTPMFFGSNPDVCIGLFIDMALDLTTIVWGLKIHDASDLHHSFQDMEYQYSQVHSRCGMFGVTLSMLAQHLIPYLQHLLGWVMVMGLGYAQMVEPVLQRS